MVLKMVSKFAGWINQLQTLDLACSSMSEWE